MNLDEWMNVWMNAIIKDGWMLNVLPSYQKYKKLWPKKKLQNLVKKVTKNEKGYEESMLVTTFKLPIITLGFWIKTAYCLHPYECSVKIIHIGFKV